jgi:hypothetical protein
MMKKIFNIVICLFLLCSTAQAGSGIFSGVMSMGGAAASCSSGTADQGNATNAIGVVTGTYFIGQSFQVTSNNSKLYSITVTLIGQASGSTDLTIRYGNGINLTTYWGTKTITHTFVSSQIDEVEFVIQDTTNTFNPGTPYYFEISANNTNGEAYFSSTSTYVGGTGYWSADSNKWNLTGHDDAGDLSFQIKVCQ